MGIALLNHYSPSSGGKSGETVTEYLKIPAYTNTHTLSSSDGAKGVATGSKNVQVVAFQVPFNKTIKYLTIEASTTITDLSTYPQEENILVDGWTANEKRTIANFPFAFTNIDPAAANATLSGLWPRHKINVGVCTDSFLATAGTRVSNSVKDSDGDRWYARRSLYWVWHVYPTYLNFSLRHAWNWYYGHRYAGTLDPPSGTSPTFPATTIEVTYEIA